MAAGLVVAGIIGAVSFKRLVETRRQRVHIRLRRIEIEDQWADFGAQEVIRAGCAECAERLQVLRVDEFENRLLIVEMAELAFLTADAATDFRHQPGGDGAAFGNGQALRHRAAKNRLAFGLGRKPFDRLVDDGKRQFVTRLGVIIPCEETMAFQHDTLGLRVGLDESFEIETELETRATPGQPADIVTENLLRQLFRILRSGNGDDCIGMHMVDMIVRHETVQRRIDGSRARIKVEGAMRQETDHAVFIRNALVNALQRFQLVEIKRRKTIELDGADIAAGALHPHDADLLARQRIGLKHLCRCVSTAIIGDALVGTEQIGTIKQLARLIERSGIGIVPTAFEKAGFSRHVFLPISVCIRGADSGPPPLMADIAHPKAQCQSKTITNFHVAARY